MRAAVAVCLAVVLLVAGLITLQLMQRKGAPGHLELMTLEEDDGVWKRDSVSGSLSGMTRNVRLYLDDDKAALALGGLVIAFIGCVGMFVATISEGLGWALAYFFFTPVVALVFTFLHWKKAKWWFFLEVLGSAMYVWGVVFFLHTT